MTKKDLEIKIDIPQKEIDRIKKETDLEIERIKNLNPEKVRNIETKFLVKKVLYQLHDIIDIKVSMEREAPEHSNRAMTNTTQQMSAQYQFLKENKTVKELELDKVRTLYGEFNLPNFDKEIEKRMKGILKVSKDLEDKKKEISKLVKDGFMYDIIFD